MRNPKRIDIILKQVKEIWVLCPDIRLGQLISNIRPESDPDLFYLEDDIMLKRLKEYKKYLKSLNKT
jgi:hypothetical protein